MVDVYLNMQFRMIRVIANNDFDTERASAPLQINNDKVESEMEPVPIIESDLKCLEKHTLLPESLIQYEHNGKIDIHQTFVVPDSV